MKQIPASGDKKRQDPTKPHQWQFRPAELGPLGRFGTSYSALRCAVCNRLVDDPIHTPKEAGDSTSWG